MLAALLLAASTPLAASDWILQPYRHASPTGRATLSVDPLDREGSGGADYAVTVDGASAWSARLPFALWEAAVADDGRVAGCYFAGDRDSIECPMHVVLLSRAGQVLFDETHPRDPRMFSHGTPTPGVVKVCLQPELERFVVYVAVQGERAAWVYDLHGGEPILQKMLVNGPKNGIAASIDVQPIPATPLVLAHWMTTDFDAVPWQRGAVFELFGRVLANGPAPRAATRLRSRWAPAEERRDEIYAHSPILATAPGRFDDALRAREKRSFESEELGRGGRSSRAPVRPTPTRKRRARLDAPAAALRGSG
jgi:hypothetical protein